MTGEDLQSIRQSMGLTQAQLAARLSYKTKTISDYERGAKRMTQAFEKYVRLVAMVGEMKKIVEPG